MNPIDTPIMGLLTSLNIDTIWIGAKLIYLVAFVVYVTFAGVIVAQVRQMNDTIIIGFEKVITIFSWAHFVLSILALLWAFMIL